MHREFLLQKAHAQSEESKESSHRNQQLGLLNIGPNKGNT